LSVIVAVVAAQYGVEGAAIGNIVRMLLATPIILFALNAWVGIPVGRTFGAVLFPMVASVVMVTALVLLKPYVASFHPIAILAILSVTGFLIYALAILALDRSLFRTVRDFVLAQVRRAAPAA
jgi:hypothetical protein